MSKESSGSSKTIMAAVAAVAAVALLYWSLSANFLQDPIKLG